MDKEHLDLYSDYQLEELVKTGSKLGFWDDVVEYQAELIRRKKARSD